MSEPTAGSDTDPDTDSVENYREDSAEDTEAPADAADAELGYESARDQLIEVVRELEAGGLSLEQSLALWERGERLANICEQHLGRARERVETAISAVTEDAADTAAPANVADTRGTTVGTHDDDDTAAETP